MGNCLLDSAAFTANNKECQLLADEVSRSVVQLCQLWLLGQAVSAVRQVLRRLPLGPCTAKPGRSLSAAVEWCLVLPGNW